MLREELAGAEFKLTKRLEDTLVQMRADLLVERQGGKQNQEVFD